MQPLSPLDGRYARTVDMLRPFFTEEALLRARIFVEVKYYLALSQERGIRELKRVNNATAKKLLALAENFSDREADIIRGIEKKTKHDVKAVEYYLRAKFARISRNLQQEFIHFALTSEDVNNLAYGILIQEALATVLRPQLTSVIRQLQSLARPEMRTMLLSLTHGQPATPTTVGKELLVFVDRLKRQAAMLSAFRMQGKFGGAVGNFMAHRSAYPDVNWEAFGRRFIRSLGLDPLQYTTQINPHDDVAELSHIYVRINTILLDLSRDIWSYVSRGVFRQKVIAGEVGSSTMPHKVNPIDFENAEGNLGLSSALFDHFAHKLPVSRLQRDLSDSTVQRNLGVAFGYHMLSLSSLSRGLTKLLVDRAMVKKEVQDHPEVLAEAIQTVMRKNGHSDAYEQMKALSRGKQVTRAELRAFVTGFDISREDKKRLLELLR